MQSPQSESTPKRLTLIPEHKTPQPKTYIKGFQAEPAKNVFASFAHHLGTASIPFNGYMAHRTLFDVSISGTVEQQKAFEPAATLLTVGPDATAQHVLSYQLFTIFLTIHT